MLNSKEEFHSKLRKFEHDILKIKGSLSTATKDKIDELFKTEGLTIYKIVPLRFAEIPLLNVSEEKYFAFEKVINEIKKILIDNK